MQRSLSLESNSSGMACPSYAPDPTKSSKRTRTQRKSSCSLVCRADAQVMGSRVYLPVSQCCFSRSHSFQEASSYRDDVAPRSVLTFQDFTLEEGKDTTLLRSTCAPSCGSHQASTCTCFCQGWFGGQELRQTLKIFLKMACKKSAAMPCSISRRVGQQ